MGVSNDFLAGRQQHNSLINQNINVLGLDYSINADKPFQILKNSINKIRQIEKIAFEILKLDIILEDPNFNTPLIREKMGIPRISIHRTGFFRNIPNKYGNSDHIVGTPKFEVISLESDAEKIHL